MFGLRKKKPKDGEEEHRYYLLPGMGRSNRRFRSKLQLWSIIAGIIGSALIGTAIRQFNRRLANPCLSRPVFQRG